jgi:hypothetical protein
MLAGDAASFVGGRLLTSVIQLFHLACVIGKSNGDENRSVHDIFSVLFSLLSESESTLIISQVCMRVPH